MRTPSQSQRRQTLILTLAITLLALGVAVQAVQAKASHYAAKSPQSAHFSTSVKIAKLAACDAISPAPFVILLRIIPLQAADSQGMEIQSELPPLKLSETVSSRLLRSPPLHS